MAKRAAASLDTATLSTATLAGLLGDRRVLLILFIAFRLLTLLVYQPLVVNGVERGVTAGGDFQYYYQLGALSGDGYLPFRDWWSEFPPIPSWLNTLVFGLAGRGGYATFALLFGVLMLAADVGNLLLVRRIGGQLHGANTGMAVAWVYALLAAPAIFIWWTFEPLVAFFLLLGTAYLVEKRDARAAITAGVGALVKFTPALILGAAWRYRTARQAGRMTAITVGIFAVVYGLLFLQNAAMTLPSLTAQFNKPSYQTVWALLDGNYQTGNFGAAIERLDPANANITEGNLSVVPGIVRLAGAAAVGAFVFARTRRFDSKGLVAFVTITLLIFFLQAQGWSPQWLAQIVPLLLLCFPTRQGILGIVLLSALTFAEYPFLFLRTAETNGTIAGALVTPFIVLVLARTAILVGFCVALYGRLRQMAG